MHLELFPLIVWIALWIINTYSKFEVNIFSNKKRYYKMSKILHAATDNNASTKAIAIPRVFYENSRAKNNAKIMQGKVVTFQKATSKMPNKRAMMALYCSTG